MLGLAACGTENFAVLERPSVSQYFSTTTPEALFYHYGYNVDPLIFRGYQIYYRYYSVTATPASSLDDFSKLAANGFTRVYSSDDSMDSSPSMSSVNNVLVNPNLADRDKTFSVYISFWDRTENEEPYLEIASTGPGFTSARTINLRRSVIDPVTEYCKKFRDIVSGDADITPALFTEYTQLGRIQIAFYAITYGIQDLTTAVPSVPVYLGALLID